MSLTPSDFAAKLKAKYPQYKDLADGVLVSRVLEKYPQYRKQLDLSPPPSEPEQSKLSRAGGTYLDTLKGMLPSWQQAVGSAALPTVAPAIQGAQMLGEAIGQIPAAAKELAPLTGFQGQKAMEKTRRDIQSVGPELGGIAAGVATGDIAGRAIPHVIKGTPKAIETTGKVLQSKPVKTGAGLAASAATTAGGFGHQIIAYFGMRDLVGGMGEWLENLGTRLGKSAPKDVDPIAGPVPGTPTFKKLEAIAQQQEASGGKIFHEPPKSSAPQPLEHPPVYTDEVTGFTSNPPKFTNEPNLPPQAGAKPAGAAPEVTPLSPTFIDAATPGKTTGAPVLIDEGGSGGTPVRHSESGLYTGEQMRAKIAKATGDHPDKVNLHDYMGSIYQTPDGQWAFKLQAGGESTYKPGFTPREEYRQKSLLLTQEINPSNKRAPRYSNYATEQIPAMNWYSDETGAQIGSMKDLYANNPKLQAWLWDKYTRQVIEPSKSVKLSIGNVPKDIAGYIDPAWAQNPEVQAQIGELIKRYRTETGAVITKGTLGAIADRVRDLNVSLREKTLPIAEKVVMRAELDSLLPVLNDELDSILAKRIRNGEKLKMGAGTGNWLRKAYGAAKEVGKDLDAAYGYSLKQGVVGPSGEVSGAKSRVTNAKIAQDEMIEKIYAHKKGSGGPRGKVPVVDVDLSTPVKQPREATPKAAKGAAGEAGAVAKPRVVPKEYTLGGKKFEAGLDMKTNLAKLQENFFQRMQEVAALNPDGKLTPEQSDNLQDEYEKATAELKKPMKVQAGDAVREGSSGTPGRESPLNENITSEGGTFRTPPKSAKKTPSSEY